MMKKTDLLSKLRFVKDKEPSVELYFLYKDVDTKSYSILRADIEESTVQKKLEANFTNRIKSDYFGVDKDGKALDNHIDWKLKHIDAVDELKDVIYYFPDKADEEDDSFTIPDEFNYMIELHDKEYLSFTKYEFSKHLLENVYAFLIRLRIDDEQIIIYKHKFSIDVLSRATILKVLNINNRFTLETDPLIKLSDRIDFIYTKGFFVIDNLKLLESKYGFNERYLKKGTEAVQLIKKKNILIDVKKLEELAKKVSFSKKIMKVKSDNEVLKTPIAEIDAFLKKYTTKDGKFSLSKRITYLPKQDKFQVKSNIAAEDFVRLLNDEYLTSLLTKKPYISDVKSDFEANDEKEKTKAKKKEKVAKIEK